MRYLRMLSNSLAAAMLATGYIVVLVLQLNPTLPLHPYRIASLAATVGFLYTLHFTVIFYVLLVLRQLLAREVFSPAWLSVGVLSWLGAAAAFAGAGLMFANLQTFALVLEPETGRRILDGGLALVVCAASFVFIASLRAHLWPRGRPIWTLLFVTTAAVSVGAPLGLRGRGMPPLPILARSAGERAASDEERDGAPGPHATIIALDAASLDLITSATAEGRLPNFGRVLDEGAVMHLTTLHPTSAEAVWTAVATGKLPQKNGVRSAATYHLTSGGRLVQLLPDYCFSHTLVRFGFLVEQPFSAAALRARTLWDILDRAGLSAGVVGWPLTYPASPLRGYLVSDAYSRLMSAPSGIEDPTTVYPPDVQVEAIRALDESGAAAQIGDTSRIKSQRELARADRLYDRLAGDLARSRETDVRVVRYQALDAAGHYFLRYAKPGEFGDVSDDERLRFGSVLEQQYEAIDEAVGRAIVGLAPGDLLLVVSGYGMEPLSILKRVLERMIGDPELSGTHEGAPDGFLMAYGSAVNHARLPTRASIVDVVPTVLYFLGLPIGRDMDGYARTDLFQPSFTRDRPLTFIPSYDR